MVRISTDGNVVGLFFYTVSQNNNTLNKYPQLPEILTDFQNVFADRLSGKFATNLSHISHHTLNMSLHYLVNYQWQKTDSNLKYVLWLI